METLRLQVETYLNEATRRAYAPSAVRRERLANSLPMTLRLYRRLSSAMVPLAPALIKRRLKQGKEDPQRVGERRGMSADVRPHGPLVWIHGASVGEVLAAAALIERLRDAQPAHPPDLGHRDLGGHRGKAVSARRHPSIRAV